MVAVTTDSGRNVVKVLRAEDAAIQSPAPSGNL